MMTDQQVEDNKTITEYMDYILPNGNSQDHNKKIANNINDFLQTDYHSSWNWLMPVVEKIVGEDSSNFHVDAPGYLYSGGLWGFNMLDDNVNGQSERSHSLIQAVYVSVVRYIKSIKK